MFSGKKTLIRATLAMVGTIIGAGMFAVPAMFAETGVVVGSVIFGLVTLAVWATHLLFLELLQRDPERRRFPGIIGEVLGPWAKRLAVVTHACQLTGANVAYLLLGGEFLWFLAWQAGIPLTQTVWEILFWFGGVVTLLFALRIVARIEATLTWALIGVLMIVLLFAVASHDPARIAFGVWQNAFMPLGVFVFALFGMTVIPEVYEITNRNIPRARAAVTVGTLVSALLTWLFGVLVFTALPTGALSDASAISFILPPALIWLVPLVGFLAVATSFITASFDLQAMLRLDFGRSALVARVATLGAPLILLFSMSRDFIHVIGTVGALFTATNGFLAVVAARQTMRARQRVPMWWREAVPWACAAVFLLTFVQRLLGNGV